MSTVRAMSGALVLVALAAGLGPGSLVGMQEEPPQEASEAEGPDPPEALAELEPQFQEDPLGAVPLLLLGAEEQDDARGTNRWLELARLIQGMDEAAAQEAGLAAIQEEDGDAEGAVERLEEALDGKDAGDSAPALAALAALMADAASDLDGDPFRSRLVDEHLESPEGPEAALLLARARLAQDGTGAREDARELLEELVVSRPDHPLVPDARRLLEELSGDGS